MKSYNHKPCSLFINSNTSRVLIALCALFVSAQSASHDGHDHSRPGVLLSPLSTFKSGSFDQGAAEIVAYDSGTQQAYVTNSETSSIDVISIAKPEKPIRVNSIDLKPHGLVNSVAVKNGLVAVALAAPVKQDAGSVAVFNLQGEHLNTFTVGALPDMVTFTPDGKTILVANEGEPNSDYSNDPEGSISLIQLNSDIKTLTQSAIKTADFKNINQSELDPSVRIFGKNASVAQDLEPEDITVSADSKTAWVSLQENNALAIVDIKQAQVQRVVGLGFKSHNSDKTAIDASDKDNAINIQKWPVFGMYQPDSIASYQSNGETYIVTANEGDARDYDGYSEEVRVGKAPLEKALLKAYPGITKAKNLGRLKITTANGDTNNNGKIDRLYSFGTRSFSIWDAQGKQVYDSGSEMALAVANRYPKLFNKDDSRSDDKGAEPEALAVGQVEDQIYAFIGLERTGGVMAYNITNPRQPYYSDYLNTISPKLEADDPKQGDIAPEGLTFISAENSPIGKPLLLSANEVSGTFSVYLVEARRQ